MNYKILLSSLGLFLIFQVGAQKSKTVDIISLSELTFKESPEVKSNQLTIRNAEGSLQVQKSVFDYQLTSGITVSKNTSNLFEADSRKNFINEKFKTNTLSTSIGLQKKFRIGLSADVSVNYTANSDNLPLDRFNQNIGAYIQKHTLFSTFSLTQPLLRGRSQNIATALEKASLLNFEGEKTNLVFRNSLELLKTGTAYWQYVTAYKSLEIFKENEARVKQVLGITKELVKADKKPAGDVAQVQADLANQERQTKVAEQNLFNAKLNLGRTIGLNEVKSKQLGSPINEFPTILESGYNKNSNVNSFIKLAQDNRSDIEASKKSEEAIELQLYVSDNNKKPQLDLSGFVNYGGMTIGNGLNNAFATLTRNEGRDLGIGVRLNFSFALNNNRAKGIYLQNKTALENQLIANENLQRNINLNVSIALNNLENSVLILQKAKESLAFYKEVYSNEQVKFQNGLTTLLNLILFQERLTFAQLEYLQAHQQFASAIINIRYETGTLLVTSKVNTTPEITKELFYTIPKI